MFGRSYHVTAWTLVCGRKAAKAGFRPIYTSVRSALSAPLQVSGWALAQSALSDTGVDAIHIWAFPIAGGAPVFVGVAAYGGSRPDVGTAFGTQFTNSAFQLSVSDLSPGVYNLVVYARSRVTGSFSDARAVQVTVN